MCRFALAGAEDAGKTSKGMDAHTSKLGCKGRVLRLIIVVMMIMFRDT